MRFFLHARVLQLIRPLPACTSVAVLEVLSKVIRPEELLGLVTLAEFVHVIEMVRPGFPVCWTIREFFAAVTTAVVGIWVGG